ncbi:MAG: recombinase family protein [Pirellulaceae bacterium]|jgi:site-specific DNA recombinase
MKTAVAYIRVSTEQQATEGVSLEAQQEKINAWCLLNDYQLVSVHVDAGLSGKRADNRPELQLALDQVTRVGGVLVVYSLSRLARSTKDTIAISERLEKAGADLVSLSEKIDTTTAAGRMVFRMLAVLAEFERDQLSERVTMAMDHKRRKSERISGRIPYGFTLAADGVALVAEPTEQNTLATIRQLRDAGASIRSIVAHLNNNQVPTKGGKPWCVSTVHTLLERITSTSSSAA